jgi:hypothetical protein
MLDILQINCVVSVMEEHFPKWVHSLKEHSRAPCVQPYYQCGERASYPQRGCNGYFLPTPMTHTILMRPSWWKMPSAHHAGLFFFLWKFGMPRYKCWSGSLICIFPHIEKHELEASFEDELAFGCFPNLFPNLGFWNWKTFFLKPCSYTLWTLFEALHTSMDT